nr:hypothetical protein [Tanacetum cinerariifolium]
MHNNIMAAGSRNRPPMLATGRYAQWQSRFLRYIDTRLNGDALRKCILQGPYTLSTIIIPVVHATDNTPAVPKRTTVETILNMSSKNKAHYESEKEAIHLLLTGIRDEIYSTVITCKTAHEIWIAIERLQQGKSLNIQNILQDDERNDKKQLDSYYDASQCLVSSTTSTKMVKEVNKIRAERIAKNANLLALVDTAQPHPDPYYQAPKSHKSYATQLKVSPPTRPHATTRHKGKEISKPITPPSENKNVDNSPMYKNDNQTEQFGNQRTVTVAEARETECMKPKRVKDSTYYKEKILLCKQAEKGVPLQAEQSDWLADTDEDINEQELEAHYNFMAKIQDVPTADS